MEEKITCAVLGATGFTGTELIKILSAHPKIKIKKISSTKKGEKMERVIPSLRKIFGGEIIHIEDFILSEEKFDVIFSSLPSGELHKIIDKIKGKAKFIVDLSPDFRVRNRGFYKNVYGLEYVSDEIENSVYGLTELMRDEIKKGYKIIGNPGCYPVATLIPIFPVLPFVEEIFVDAKSGVTGAGRILREDLTYSYLSENMKVYSAFTHRHVPEMENFLKYKNFDMKINFSTSLIPAKRGILETIWIKLKKNLTKKDILEIFSVYSEEFFVDFWEEELPDIYSVIGTNFLRFGFRLYGNTLLLVSVIDNLIKGAAGQAIQNMNILFSLPENEGLYSLRPIFS